MLKGIAEGAKLAGKRIGEDIIWEGDRNRVGM
jgi:hypothetical protein